jgi:hypothetical protein
MRDAIIMSNGKTQIRNGVEKSNNSSNFQPIARKIPIEMKN